MKKTILIIEAVIAILILTGAVFLFLPKGKIPAPGVENTPPVVNGDIEVFSPKPNDAISSPLKITGIVRGNGWSGFEGQVGEVILLDGNGKELTTGVLKTTTDWGYLPTNFEATLDFAPPAGGAGQLVFHNENPSGDPVRDKTFVVPIKFR